MKTAISSYSFAALMRQGTETVFSVITKARELGFDAIEFIDLEPVDGLPPLAVAQQLRDEAARVGIEICCYSVGADLLKPDLAAEVKRVQAQVDIAAALGVKLMRHDATFGIPGAGFDTVVDRLADGCRQITEYAAARGIKTMVENHGFFCQDSHRVERLVNKVAHSNFGWLVDTGNFLCVDESPVTAVGRAAPYAFHVHIKDFLLKSGEEGCPGDGFIHTRGGGYIRGTIAGHGVVPLRQCVAALKRAGYDGYLTLEFEGCEEIHYALEQGAKYIKKLAEL